MSEEAIHKHITSNSVRLTTSQPYVKSTKKEEKYSNTWKGNQPQRVNLRR